MKKSITRFKKIKTQQIYRPSKLIIQNLLNYSQTIEFFPLSKSKQIMWVNN